MRTAVNGIYHVVNRGVDKRKIFLDEADYSRFIHDLFEFNDVEPVLNFGRYFAARSNPALIDVGRQSISRGKEKRKPRRLLVEVLAFCLMPNHYHLLLKERVVEGIPLFMKKLGGGYAKYFNIKYERTGTLFERRYKAILIKSDAHFLHIPYYIHLNPLDLRFPEWRNGELKNRREAVKFLENYRWSSYPDYIGKKNFPSVTQREFLLRFFKGSGEYKKKMISWLKDLDPEDISNRRYYLDYSID